MLRGMERDLRRVKARARERRRRKMTGLPKVFESNQVSHTPPFSHRAVSHLLNQPKSINSIMQLHNGHRSAYFVMVSLLGFDLAGSI